VGTARFSAHLQGEDSRRARRPVLPAAAAAMLGHLRRSLCAFHRLPATGQGHAACNPIPLHRFWSSHIVPVSGWCNKHATRDFCTSEKVTRGRVYQPEELEPTTPAKVPTTISLCFVLRYFYISCNYFVCQSFLLVVTIQRSYIIFICPAACQTTQ